MAAANSGFASGYGSDATSARAADRRTASGDVVIANASPSFEYPMVDREALNARALLLPPSVRA